MDTILVVDDESNYLTVMETLLGEAGYEVLTAPSAIEALNKILNPFFTTKEKGSGLGLPIVKSIIQAHQGSLEISSTAGAGTTITITIPPLALEKVS